MKTKRRSPGSSLLFLMNLLVGEHYHSHLTDFRCFRMRDLLTNPLSIATSGVLDLKSGLVE